jgi:hypothetical protein
MDSIIEKNAFKGYINILAINNEKGILFGYSLSAFHETPPYILKEIIRFSLLL